LTLGDDTLAPAPGNQRPRIRTRDVDDAVLGVAFALALGGLVLVFMAAVARPPDGPLPPGGPPSSDPYTAALRETSYQRRRVGIVGVVCLLVAVVLAIISVAAAG